MISNQLCYRDIFKKESIIFNSYNNIILNSQGRSCINKFGVTKLCLRSREDIAGISPPAAICELTTTFYTRENGVTTSPMLLISYSRYPSKPGNPSPYNGTTEVGINPTLSVDVSIIVPAHNEEECLEDTIDSIVKNVTIRKYEILICDDHSTDKTVEKAFKYSVTIISHDSASPAAGEYIGFMKSVGKYVFFHQKEEIFQGLDTPHNY